MNQVRIRTWDHFPVITRVEGQELSTKKCVKGWAGWTPVSEGEVAKFQELVLRPRGARDEVALCEGEDGEGLSIYMIGLVTSCFRDQSYHDLVQEQEKVLRT